MKGIVDIDGIRSPSDVARYGAHVFLGLEVQRVGLGHDLGFLRGTSSLLGGQVRVLNLDVLREFPDGLAEGAAADDGTQLKLAIVVLRSFLSFAVATRAKTARAAECQSELYLVEGSSDSDSDEADETSHTSERSLPLGCRSRSIL